MEAEANTVVNRTSRKRRRRQKRKNKKKRKNDDNLLEKQGGKNDNNDDEEVMKEFECNNGTLSDWLNPKHKYYRKDFASEWKDKKKSLKKVYIGIDKKILDESKPKVETYPFPTTEDDHCETSPEAYNDINIILEYLAKKIGKSKSELQLYDPYYCAGTTIKHLNNLGFFKVYNKCEDFYSKIASKNIPDHDVLITNPPYSDDHVEKLFEFLNHHDKPCLLLMPSYVCNKDYFHRVAEHFTFLYPLKRYVYWTPKGLRKKQQNHASTLGIRTSPFVSMWYLNLSPLINKTDLFQLRIPKTLRLSNTISSLPRSINSS